MSNRTIIHNDMVIYNDAEMQAVYQKSLKSVVCCEKLQKKILAEMEWKQEELQGKACNEKQKRTSCSMWPRFNVPATVVVAIAIMAGVLLPDTSIVHAFEQMVTKGIGYFVKDINGVEDVMVAIHGRLWNREIEVEGHDLSDWKEYYPEFYSELEENNLMDIFLPHYEMGEYEWVDKVDYVGKPLEEGEAIAGAKFVQGDSGYYLCIHKLDETAKIGFNHKVDKQYQMEANEIVYEIIELSEEYTYEEYVKIQEYIYRNSTVSHEDETWFEEFMKRPIHVGAMVNGVYYSYTLSRDIDLEEFLASIS